MPPVKKRKPQPTKLHQFKEKTESDIKEVNNNSAAGCEKIVANPAWRPPTIYKLKSEKDKDDHDQKCDAGTSQLQTSISSVTIKTCDESSSGNTQLDTITRKPRGRRGRPKNFTTWEPLVMDSESSNGVTSITTDSTFEFIKPPPTCKYITRSVVKELKMSKLENVTSDNSENNVRPTTIGTSAEIYSVPEVTTEKTEDTYTCGKKLAKKSQKSKSVATNSKGSTDSKHFNFTSLKVMDSTPEIGKSNTKLQCNEKDLTSWKKSQELQPNNNLDTANEDTFIAPQLGNNSILRTAAVGKTTCTYECRGKIYDHSNDSLSDSSSNVDSIPTSMKSRIKPMYKKIGKLQSNLVQSKTVNISIISKPEAEINVSKPTAVKRRSRKAIDKETSSGTLVVNQNSSVGSVDLSSTSCVESDSTPQVLTEKVKRTRQPKKKVQKDLVNSKQLEGARIPTCKVEDTYPTPETITDSTSETSKSETVMAEYLPEPVVRRQKMQISSSQDETGKAENAYPAIRTITDSTSEISTSVKLVVECKKTRHISSDQEKTDNIKNTYPTPETITDSTSETLKSETVMAEYLPEPVVRRQKMQISSNQEKTGKAENTYPATGTITNSTSETSKSVKPVIRRKRMRISSDEDETSDKHVVEVGDRSLDCFLVTDSVSTKMPFRNIQLTHQIRVQENLMNSTVVEMEYHPVINTKDSVYDSDKNEYLCIHNTKDADKDESASTKCKERLSLISNIVKIEDALHSNLYQPRVLLHDIAYDKELSQELRDMYLKKNTSRDVVRFKNLLYPTATASTEQSIKYDISGVSSKTCSENDQSITSSNTKLRAHKHECKNLQEQKLHNPFLLMHPGPVESVRGTKSSSTISDTDVLSSLIEYPLKQQKFSVSTGLSLEPCSPTKINNTEINLTESIVTHQEDNLTEPLFEKRDLELPLDLRVNSSITSVTNEADLLPCNVNSVKLGSSNFKLMNLNTSYIEGDDRVNFTQPLKNIKINQDIDERNIEKQMLSHLNPQGVENIQARSTDSICNPNQTPVRTEKWNLSNGLSLKVSIPIYFTNPNSGQVVQEENLATANKIETHNSLKLLGTHQPNSNETVELSSVEKCNEPSKLTKNSNPVDEDNNYDNIGLTTTLDLINIEDDNGSCFAEALKNSSADIFSVPTEAEQPIQQSTPIRKKLPKIVSDEILPKGTIAIPPSKHMSLVLFKADTADRTHLNDVDNAGKNQDLLIASNGHSAEQDGKNDIQSEYSQRNKGVDQIHNTDAEPFDASNLLTYCPELATLLSANDTSRNNNSKIVLSDTDFFNDNSKMNQNPPSVSNTVVTETNTDNVDLSTNDNVNIPRSKNELRNTFEGVGAPSADYVANEMDTESSEMINTKSARNPSPVIAELTIANLRNFTKIFNTTAKPELTWCIDTHHYYPSQTDDEKCKELSDINEVPEDRNDFSEATKTEVENQSPLVKTKQRKRKWISDNSNKDQGSAPFGGKRIQLKRNRWNFSGPRGVENKINFQKSSSIISNTSIVSTTTNTVAGNKQSSKNGSSTKEIVLPKNDETQQSDSKTENLMPNINTCPTPFEKNYIDNKFGAFKHGFCEDNVLPNRLSTSPKDTEDCNCNSNFDKNENLTNPVLASPFSSQKSASNIERSDRSIPTKEIDGQNMEKGDTGLDNHPFKKESEEEELDYEYDDCISLFAESIAITNVDQSLNFMDDPKKSPCESKNPSEKTYEDIKDFGTYYKKNLEECDAAYEFGVETEKNECTTSNIIMPSATKNNDNRMNINNSSNMNPVPQMNTQYSASKFSSAMNPPTSNLTNSSSIRNRLGIKQITLDRVYNFSSRIFKRHCFRILTSGFCRKLTCRFLHNLTIILQHLAQEDLDYVAKVILYAETSRFNHFINIIYRQLARMDSRNIIELFYKLYCTGQLSEHLVNCTVQALSEIGIPLRTIVSDIALLFDEIDIRLVEYLIEFISDMIQPGTYWDTFRDLLIKRTPSQRIIIKVICELVETNKDKSHIEDVYINFINKLGTNQVSVININLRNRLNSILMKNGIIQKNNQNFYTPLSTQNDSSYRMSETSVSKDINTERNDILSIISPDSTQYSDSELLLSRTSQRSNLQGPTNTQSLFISQDDSLRSIAADPNDCNQKRNSEIESNPPVTNFSATSSSRTSELEAANSTSDSFKVHLIDDLKEPRSAYRSRHREFHNDMRDVINSLKFQNYQRVLTILYKYSDVVEKSLFTTSCYRMLHKNVIMSAHHIKNMIQLSVRMGVNKSLTQTLFNLGIYTMIELCDAGAWVIAYSLFKTLQATGLMENIAEYALISAEILIANGRPLKAFTILKQSNMFCTNRSKWLVTSNPNDERVRIVVLNLLLDILCQDFPEQAFFIFTYLVGDQSRIYHPIDLTAYTDNLVAGIINGKCNDLVPEVARIVIENNFSLSNSVFQSLVINLFKKDLKRCKQLYRYGTWLGVYPIVGLALPLRILIKTNWVREEIYLAVANFLEKLSVDVGHAIDQIGPNQFSIHLVFELAPFKQQLPDTEDQVCNIDELKMSKKLMKTVLEEFNPPLKTMYKERERFMKLQSRTVVNYLKGMNTLQ